MSVFQIEIPEQKTVIDCYGKDTQAIVHCEETAELIHAISKLYRVTNSPATYAERDNARLNLIEEIADTLISIKQMIEMYEISEQALQDVIDKKCKRQEERVNAELSRRNYGRETCEA